ncbi:protein disulfide-isomerase A4 [Rhodnius prolixus]|uniref:Putative thioredoxin/protein disulfide isomerase n=2 Tax=Rhodnius TaxID=13248 RepID=R4G8E4_RHOPR
MMIFYGFAYFISLLVICYGEQGELEIVDDAEMVGLIRNEKYVIVLFSKKDCAECDKLETALTSVREDLVETLNAWVVKTISSQMVKLYNPAKEPTLVFFRHGVPLLYDGEPNEEVILHFFTENKEPVVKELTDDNFESLTQAASGATTGDWFIMFYSNDCFDCQRLMARWETVAAKLRTRLNVAIINRKSTGRVTSRRFHVIDTPTFLFFRLGKMYHYNIPKYDIASFVSFATEWFRNARSEKVPLPKTPFDDLTQMIADYLRENSWIIKLFSIIICIVITLSLVKKLRAADVNSKKSNKEPKEKSSTKQDKSKKKE